MHDREKSDPTIVAEKPPAAGGGAKPKWEGADLSDARTTGASALQHPDTAFVSLGSTGVME